MNRAFYVSLRVGHREFIGDGPTRQAARHNAAQKALRILKNLPVQTDAKKEEEKAEEETNGMVGVFVARVHLGSFIRSAWLRVFTCGLCLFEYTE